MGFSVSWLGTGMGMIVLSGTGLVTEGSALRHYAYAYMHIFDLAIVIPLVLLSIISGFVVSLGTRWGLIRYWWVLAKLVIALGIVTLAAVKENFWVRGLAEITAEDPAANLGGGVLYLAVTMVVFSIALWIATILSIYKPWGRTWWGQRQFAKEAAAAKAKAAGRREG